MKIPERPTPMTDAAMQIGGHEVIRLAKRQEQAIAELMEALINIQEYWNGDNEYAPDACEHSYDVAEETLAVVKEYLK